MSRKTWAWGFLLLLAATLIVSAGLKILSGKTPPAAAFVKVRTLPTAEGPQEASGPRAAWRLGDVVPFRSARVAAEVAGQVVERTVREGLPVTAGQVLFRLDDRLIAHRLSELEALVDQAGAQIEEAQLDLADSEELLRNEDVPAISEREVGRYRTRLASLHASREALLAQVAYQRTLQEKTTLHAPWDGIVDQVFVEIGEYVVPGSPLCSLADGERIKIPYYVPERDVASIREGDAVRFTADAFPDREFSGKVWAIRPSADPATRRFQVILQAANPKDTPLRPGMILRVRHEVALPTPQ